MTALVADIWTLLYSVLIVGWQTIIFFREGSWPALPLSSALNMLEYDHHAIYTTAATRGIEKSHLTGVTDTLLGLPAVILLVLAAALLTTFYLWLTRTERRYSRN